MAENINNIGPGAWQSSERNEMKSPYMGQGRNLNMAQPEKPVITNPRSGRRISKKETGRWFWDGYDVF